MMRRAYIKNTALLTVLGLLLVQEAEAHLQVTLNSSQPSAFAKSPEDLLDNDPLMEAADEQEHSGYQPSLKPINDATALGWLTIKTRSWGIAFLMMCMRTQEWVSMKSKKIGHWFQQRWQIVNMYGKR